MKTRGPTDAQTSIGPDARNPRREGTVPVNTIDQLSPPQEPFTVDKLKEILSDVLKPPLINPGKEDLELLADELNFIADAHARAKQMVPVSRAKWARAQRVQHAFAVLMHFFEERRHQTLCTDGIHGIQNAFAIDMDFFEKYKQVLIPQHKQFSVGVPVRGHPMEKALLRHRTAFLLEGEKRLCDQWDRFVQAVEEHTFSLEMDMDERGAMWDMDEYRPMMPDHSSWSGLDEMIANAFRLAMARNNPTQKLGRTNSGPVPRFVAAVVPLITGEKPPVTAVGKHLIRRASSANK